MIKVLKYAKKNGLVSTFRHCIEYINEYYRVKFKRGDFKFDAKNKIDEYAKKSPNNHRRIAIKMILWNLFSLVRSYKSDRKVNSDCSIQLIQSTNKNNTIELPPLEKDLINVAFIFKGGMGDFLIHLNYLMYFYNKYSDYDINISVFAHVSYNMLNVFRNHSKNIFWNLYREEKNEKFIEQHDIVIELSRYPELKKSNMQKVARICPDLLEYLFLIKRYYEENQKMFTRGGDMAGQSAVMSEILNIKRVQQPDIYSFFNISEDFKYEFNIPETDIFIKNNLNEKKVITVHRGCDANHSSYSTKLWPLEYYNALIRLIKKRYPDYKIVQLGISEERCPVMKGVDVNLVGKTSIEELMFLLANSFLHIDGEGGMIHLRHALCKKKSIVMFGPTSPKFFGYSENDNIKGNGCMTTCEWVTRNWQEQCLRNENKAPCMYSIVPEMVMKYVERIINNYEEK